MDVELPDEVHDRIVRDCEEGDAFVNEERYSEAIACFEQALSLVPTPQEHWDAATWIYAAIGDTRFLAGQYELARQALTMVMLCPNALENPFVWLRRGQVYFELGDMKQAQDSLASAFMLAGPEIFESEDPKYASFILPQMNSQQSRPG